jgi:hypothetical protein
VGDKSATENRKGLVDLIFKKNAIMYKPSMYASYQSKLERTRRPLRLGIKRKKELSEYQLSLQLLN